MPFLIIFGIIVTLIGGIVKHFTLKEVNPDLCGALQQQQAKDIENNKKVSTILIIVGLVILTVGLLGVFL